MTYTYTPHGVCSKRIDMELEGNVIKAVSFTGGCHGNLQGVSRLVEGMTVEEAATFASATSALKCTRVGAQEGIPDFEEVLAFMKENKEVIRNG